MSTVSSREMRDVSYLVTHSGSFHADDVFAYAMLSALFPDATLVRTREAETLTKLASEAITFDVGGVFDPETRRFDHHQQGRPLREDGMIPYSSFGLLWQHYGPDYLTRCLGVPGDDAASVAALVDQGLVVGVDAVDNGVVSDAHAGGLHPLSISGLLLDFRPDFDSGADPSQDSGFISAAEIARHLLAARCAKAASEIRARAVLEEAMAARPESRWVELPAPIPVSDIIGDLDGAFDAEALLFTLTPKATEWEIGVIRRSPTTFEARKDLPEEWDGLRGADLAAVTGVADSVFCHAKRFIAITKTREGALTLLEQALSN